MEKIMALLTVIELVADAVNPELGKKLRAAVAEVQDEFKQPDFVARVVTWAQHHGNMPGTPASRGEVKS